MARAIFFEYVSSENKHTPTEKNTWKYVDEKGISKTFTFWAGKRAFSWKCEGEIDSKLFNRFMNQYYNELSDLVCKNGAHNPLNQLTQIIA